MKKKNSTWQFYVLPFMMIVLIAVPIYKRSLTKQYVNLEHHFSLRIPKGYTYVMHNNTANMDHLLLYDKGLEKYKTYSVSADPFVNLVELSHNPMVKASYEGLIINSNSSIAEPGFSLKKYIEERFKSATRDVPSLEFVTWEGILSTDGKTEMYNYILNIPTQSGFLVRGVAWISQGKMYTLESFTGGTEYLTIARSFIQF